MGKLIEFPIKTLFNGVSRQPDPIRIPGQVEDAENVVLSVETGGFSKRHGSRHVAKLTGYVPSDVIQSHVIDRDPSERYVVVKNATALRVFDVATGAEKTVNPYSADVAAYLSGTDFAFVTVADYTFVLNRQKTALMDAVSLAPAQQNIAVVQVKAARSGVYSVTVGGVLATYTATTTLETNDIAEKLRLALVAALPVGVHTIVRDSGFLFISRVDGTDFTIVTSDPGADTDLALTKGTVKATSELPARAPSGMVVKVGNDDDGEYWVKFAAVTGNKGIWRETVAPGSKINFNAATMPHVLVRETNGTFTVKTATWNPKTAGTDDTAPLPEFIDRQVKDIVFHRNRLALVADESIYFSQAGDFFNFWPEKTTEVLDSDPFGLTAPGNQVSLLNYVIPFRKALFVTADSAQFEVSGDVLTGKRAAIDLATSYSVSRNCRPCALGDVLYLASENGKSVSVLEYSYDDSSVSNTAIDITKHVRDYVPASLLSMVGDPVTGNLFCLSSADRSAIYVYTVFWNGEDRAQSAWGRWSLEGAYVHSMSVLAGYLVLVVRRGDDVFLERITISDQDYGDYAIVPRLDREYRTTGTYDAVTNRTTFALPYSGIGTKALTSTQFASESARTRDLTLKPNGNSVSVSGNWTGGEVAFGYEFPSSVEFSKQYVRENDTTILNGRLQLRTMTFFYEDSGWFQVEVIPEARESQVSTFTGRVIGTITNLIGRFSLQSGVFKVRIGSRADTVRIRVVNDTFLPHTITSAAWVGFFNEISRQG
jgi:hypothetical protein